MAAAAISAPAGVQPRTLSRDATSRLLAGLVCILLFALLNPLVALFLLSVLSLYRPLPTVVFIVSAACSFTLFFYSREFGIEMYPGSTDDIPQYIAMYEANYGLSFGDVLRQFIELPNGGEPLWHLPWWALLNGFDMSDDTFVFAHYLAVFLASFAALATLSRRYLAPFALVYFLLTPIALDSVAHIWRQQLAFCIFLAGIGLYLVRGVRAGRWLLYLSLLMHVSVIFFLLGYFVFATIRRVLGFDRKLVVSLLIGAVLVIVPVLSSMMVFLLDSLGVGKIMAFFEGYGADPIRVYLIIGLYAVPLLVTYYLLRNDAANHLFMVLCFLVFSIVLALPGANGIYDRLLMFVVPLLGFYFWRCMLLNFSSAWYLPALTVVFVTGMFRIYLPTREDAGIMYFLAYGHAFDPFMGMVKMLANL
jgi:EpsG-like putative glucosyltransferase